MKLFCTFAVCAILAFISVAKADDVMEATNACLAEVNVTPEELDKFFRGGMNPADATDDVECHLKCMYEEIGFLKDGVFDIQFYMNNVDNIPKEGDRKDEIVEMVTACTAEKGDNPCDTAFKVTMCLKNIQDALGLNPN